MSDTLSSSTLLAVLGSLLAAYLIHYNIKKFSFWSSRGVKGPRPWPIFGTNIYYVFRNKLDVDSDWLNRYGKVYGIYEGYEPTLRILDNELVKHVFIKEFCSFTDRNSKTIHGENAKKWLLWSKGNYWSNQRAMVTPMFTSSKMRLMFGKMTECIENFLKEAEARINPYKLAKNATTHGETRKNPPQAAKKTTTFVLEDIMDMTLDVIASSFFSIKLNTYRDKTNEFLCKAYQVGELDFYWFIIWLLTPTPLARYLRLDLVPFWKYKYFDHLSQSIINERRRTLQNKSTTTRGGPDFMQAFLEAKVPEKYEPIYSQEDDFEAHYNDQIKLKELEQIQEVQVNEAKLFRHFSDLEIRGSMTFFYLAGFNATALTINSCIYELCHQPDAQMELLEELLHVLGEESGGSDIEPSAPLSSKLDYSKLLNLTKLDAFVAETMRLYSTLIENNRVVTAARGVKLPTSPQIELPEGTSIVVNFFLLHRHPDYFDRPTQFDMSRFYPQNRDKIKSCTYMPFGVGPRNCPGLRFALMEIKLFLAKLLLQYSLEPGPRNQRYPPEFQHHPIFLQLKNTDFRLIPRKQTMN